MMKPDISLFQGEEYDLDTLVGIVRLHARLAGAEDPWGVEFLKLDLAKQREALGKSVAVEGALQAMRINQYRWKHGHSPAAGFGYGMPLEP